MTEKCCSKEKSIRKWKSALFEHVGCLIDTPSYYPNLSAYENLAYIQKMVGKPLKEIDRVLHVTGIFKARDKKVKHFSLGMRQRLGLAMALLNDPEVLILDEPTNGLDPEGIHEIRYLLIDLCRQEGKTVFRRARISAEMEMMAGSHRADRQRASDLRGSFGDVAHDRTVRASRSPG